MNDNFGQIFFLILYPALLSFIQLLIPTRVKALYKTLIFIGLFLLGLVIFLYVQGGLFTISVSYLLIGMFIPVLFAMFRFWLNPLYKHYHRLLMLKNILGAVDWGLERTQNIDTYSALEHVESTFSFMGFGFSKYLKATNDYKSISGKTEINNSLLWQKIKSIYFNCPKRPLKVLLMNPLAYEIEKYSRVSDQKYPQVEDLYFSLDCLNDIRRTFGDIIQVKFYPNSLTYKPSFRLFFFNDYDLYLSFYQWGTTASELPFIHLKKSDKNFYYPFQVLFDFFWEHGEYADIENLPFIITLKDVYTRNSQILERVKRYINDQLPTHLKEIPFHKLRIAAAAIAGNDSALSILEVANSGDYDCIIPIMIGAPAEHLTNEELLQGDQKLGDFAIRSETIKKIKKVLESSTNEGVARCVLLNVIYLKTGTRPWIDVLRKMENKLCIESGDIKFPARMAQAAQGFALDLADALAGQAELLPDLFERVGAPVIQPKAQAQDARLARGQGIEHCLTFSRSRLA
jgi:hypothetical protein